LRALDKRLANAMIIVGFKRNLINARRNAAKPMVLFFRRSFTGVNQVRIFPTVPEKKVSLKKTVDK
jgi:hypothetical protein